MRARPSKFSAFFFALSLASFTPALAPRSAEATTPSSAATSATPRRAEDAARPADAAATEPAADLLLDHVKRAVVVVNTYDERGRLQSQGSGFFVRRGQVVTNLHVVGRAARVEVRTFDGQSHAAAGVVAFSEARDLALLQTDCTSPDVSNLAVDERAPREGEEVFVVGNPQGRAWAVSRGQTLAVWESQDVGALVRISAAISRGSSGSPVVNMRGRVVGVATLTVSGGGDSFFAVPAEQAARLRPGDLKTFPLQLTE